MLRLLTGLVVVTVGLVLVGQSIGQDDAKKPDFFGKIKEVKGDAKAGTLTVTTMGKDVDSKDVTLKVGKDTEIVKGGFGKGGGKGKATPAEFGDLKEGGFVAVWTVEGKADVAKKLAIGGGKKKKAD